MNKAKLLSGALSGIMAAAMTVSAMTASADVLKLGDPTGDGIIDSIDASYILSLYADLSVNGEEIADEIVAICDVDKDGKVNSLDASLILSYYANQSIGDTIVSLEEFIAEISGKVDSWWPENANDLEFNPVSPWSWDYPLSLDTPWGKWDPDSYIWGDENANDLEFNPVSPWSWDYPFNDIPWGSLRDENGQVVTKEETTTSGDNYVSKIDSRYCFWIDISKDEDYVFNDDFVEVHFKLKDNIPEKDYAVRINPDFSTIIGNSISPDKVIQGNIRVGSSIDAQDVSSETGFVVYGDNISAKPGEEVCYRINFKNNPGMAGMLVWIYYDSNAMEVEDIIPSGEFAEFASFTSTGKKSKN